MNRRVTVKLLVWAVVGCAGRTSPTSNIDGASGGADGASGQARGDGGEGEVEGKRGGDMVLVPEGAFWMGCKNMADEECDPAESPYHQVTLPAFRIDRTEVTVEAYAACHKAGRCSVPYASKWCTWDYVDEGGDADGRPIDCVHWQQARDFCAWAGKRLPTEAEWEKAARGTDERIYPWGDDPPTCEMGNFRAEEGYCASGDTMPVGSFPNAASPHGALDMAGNVAEWVADWYSSSYYASSPDSDPRGPDSGLRRGMRGGSAATEGWYLRAAHRDALNPAAGGLAVGFRCAAEP